LNGLYTYSFVNLVSFGLSAVQLLFWLWANRYIKYPASDAFSTVHVTRRDSGNVGKFMAKLIDYFKDVGVR
jgi:hypothetical protein